jgi:glutathione S-transferase
MPLTLYYHPLASYCHKVLIALYENGIAFEGRIVDLGDARQRAELQAVWPLAKFPVIRDSARGVDLAESSIIIEYLDQFFPGDRPLIPADRERALQTRLWDRVFDNYVQGPMQEIVGDRLRNANGDMAPARALLDTAYAAIDRQLGNREWIVGDGFGLADCAAAPALFYATTLQPFPGGCARIAAYFDRLMDRPSVRRTLEEARPWFRFYPFAEAIPQRFR